MITSSKISSAPDASESARNASRKPGAGGTTPRFPATGSTMIAARPSPYRSTAAAAASMSLYGVTIVSRAAPVVTPALAGIPSVASPEPAETSSASEWPW